MDECYDPLCGVGYRHAHGTVYAPNGHSAPAIISLGPVGYDPRAEVRDPETGEMIFPATKGPLKVIPGGKA